MSEATDVSVDDRSGEPGTPGVEASDIPSRPDLRKRRGGAPVEVDPDRPTRIQGEPEWVVEGTPEQIDAVERALPDTICDRLAPGVALLAFGNTVGRLEIPGIGTVEVVSGKWTGDDFDAMLEDLTEVATALPFTADDTAALPYDRTAAARDDVLYHAFVYLRHVLSGRAPREKRLDTALRVIVNDPHRVWETTTHHVPPGRAGRIEPGSLPELVSSAMVRVPEGAAASSPLVERLHGHLPERVAERRVRHTVDTPENRFVKAFLDQALGIADRVRTEAAERRPAFAARIAADAERIERYLEPIARASLWNDVAPMTHLPLASTVLQRRRGYREVLEHFSRLRMAARIPLDADGLRDVIEARDIATLYELWCYFTVVRTLEEILGPPSRAERVEHGALRATVRHEFRVEWGDAGVRAVYNARFRRSRAGRRSYSRPLRPDIAVRVTGPSGPVFHLFDAKFRVDRKQYPKPTDLYKMHAYRDAIVRARTAWVLYPGTRYRAYSAVPGEVGERRRGPPP
ncbi:MAG: DUF2357 domain-containing protein, partial [Gemmatimonadota bacterium]